MKDIFKLKNNQYSFRTDAHLQSRNVNTALYGTEAISSSGAQIFKFSTLKFELFKILSWYLFCELTCNYMRIMSFKSTNQSYRKTISYLFIY